MPIADSLRMLVGAGEAEYTVGEVAYWTDNQLDNAADRYRVLHVDATVKLTWQNIDGETVARFGRVAAPGTFEAGMIGELRDEDGALVEDWTVGGDGLLEFDEPLPSGTVAYWTGYTFDLNAAASSVLYAWAAHVKEHYDVTTDGQSMKRSQKYQQLTQLAERYARGAVASLLGSRSGRA